MAGDLTGLASLPDINSAALSCGVAMVPPCMLLARGHLAQAAYICFPCKKPKHISHGWEDTHALPHTEATPNGPKGNQHADQWDCARS